MLNYTVSDLKLPVAQMAPPTITKGQNFGLFSMMFTTKETVHIAAHKIHWKNIPAQLGEQKINEILVSTLSLFRVFSKQYSLLYIFLFITNTKKSCQISHTF